MKLLMCSDRNYVIHCNAASQMYGCLDMQGHCIGHTSCSTVCDAVHVTDCNPTVSYILASCSCKVCLGTITWNIVRDSICWCKPCAGLICCFTTWLLLCNLWAVHCGESVAGAAAYSQQHILHINMLLLTMSLTAHATNYEHQLQSQFSFNVKHACSDTSTILWYKYNTLTQVQHIDTGTIQASWQSLWQHHA